MRSKHVSMESVEWPSGTEQGIGRLPKYRMKIVQLEYGKISALGKDDRASFDLSHKLPHEWRTLLEGL